MLTSVLSRTATRSPHRAVLILARSKGSTSVPPPNPPQEISRDGGDKTARPAKVSNSELSSKKTSKVRSDAAKAEEPKARASATEPTLAHAPPKSPPAADSSMTPTSPQHRPAPTTVDAIRNVHINPEERQWHATVIHGRGVLEAYRHPRTHGIPVASVQFRAHSPEPIQLAAHFASHAAASLGIPLSGVASLPTRRTLWTVPRGPFAHKKSQENFERRVHARAIKAFDADAEVVDRWVRYLEAHALPGVGMRVVRWHRLPVGIGRSHLQSVVGRMRLGRPTNKDKVKELGDKIVEVESKAANNAIP